MEHINQIIRKFETDKSITAQNLRTAMFEHYYWLNNRPKTTYTDQLRNTFGLNAEGIEAKRNSYSSFLTNRS